jgi:hypothetical protein
LVVYFLLLGALRFESVESATRKRPEKNPEDLSALERKFYIKQKPELTWDGDMIHLDYMTSDWMTSEYVAHLLKDFECKEKLESSPLDVASPFQKLDDASYDGFQTWRVSLKIAGKVSGWWKKKYEVCVRFMLYNLPLSNDDAIEVNFVHTQLAIQLDGSGAISDIQLTIPDDIAVKVNVMGRGTAKVFKADSDEVDADDKMDGAAVEL